MTHTLDGAAVNAIADLARQGAQAQQLDKRGLYLAIDIDGATQLINVSDEIRDFDDRRPVRKRGTYRVAVVEHFIEYLAKHGENSTELWADAAAGTITAIIDAHGGDPEDANHEEHKSVLTLRADKDWQEWAESDGKLFGQAEFAEFIEDHLPNFITPEAADMLELAQTFQATTKVDFASSQRIKSGETQLLYAETTSATAGKKGSLAIPDTITLALRVYERGELYQLSARFRYRITDGTLRLGYRLQRPDDTRLLAFDEATGLISATTGRSIWLTS